MRTGSAYGLVAILLTAAATTAWGQTPWPAHLVEDRNWTSGAHTIAVTPPILAPGGASHPVSISATAEVEFVSATGIELKEGLYAGDLTGNGFFEARIDTALGADADVVVIAPELTHHFGGNILHVNKWEKMEVGLQLPQAYTDAIDRFFAHYYADPLDPYVATPGNVDPVHDLNPYADDSLQVVITLTKPDGTQAMKWGFFMREGKWSSTAPTALLAEDPDDPLFPYAVRFRLAPDMEGAWQFNLSIKAPHTHALGGAPLNDLAYTGYSFVCDPPLSDNHGPLHVNDANHRTLQFEDGTAFFGLGTNMADRRISTPGVHTFCQRDLFYMQKAMEQLHEVGGNFMRMFLMRNIFAPEWVNLGVYDAFKSPDPCSIPSATPTTRGNCQYQCWAFDQMLDSARVNNIQVQLCIDPYPPITAYENFIWGNHAYMIHFIEPHPQTPPLNKYDLKRFFFNDGDPSNTGSGVFYYWKRKYKYIMSRWGYSVNIAAIEPFNEIDQMLSYQTVTVDDICYENDGTWNADPELPGVLNDWVTDITDYVRGDVDLSDPVSSPLGEANKLFLMSYTNAQPPGTSVPDYFLPFTNPNVDLVDVHHGMYWGDAEEQNSFDDSQNYRDVYTSTVNGVTYKKPFHPGESNYYQFVDINPIDTITDYYDSNKVFDNYDVSFHNEIWASTFFGNFAAACTWYWERVFWWPNALPTPPPESIDQNHWQPNHTNILGAVNILNPNDDSVHVRNRTLYHNFKPLSNFLTNPNLQAYDLFNGDFDAHKVYDDVNKIETYYLTNADQTMAIGWVHNLNAYWEKHYYVKNDSTMQNFFGCTAPGSQQVSISGLQSGMDYHVTWFPTRMNDTIRPADAVDTSGTGTVLLDMGTAPLGDTLNKYLDTLHVDYAFIIALQPVHRNLQVIGNADSSATIPEWSFSLYPNPASDLLNIILTDDTPANIDIYDLSGRLLHSWIGLRGPLVRLSVSPLARGTYFVRTASGEHCQVEPLIIR